MTTIVGLISKHTGDVFIGSDSYLPGYGAGYADPKHFQIHFHDTHMVCGWTGNIAVAQFVQNELPKICEKDDIVDLSQGNEPIGLVQVGKCLRRALRREGLLLHRDKDVPYMDLTLLIALNSKLFCMSGVFGIVPAVHQFLAVGPGEYAAEAALLSLEKVDQLRMINPNDAVRHALDVAADMVNEVKVPFRIDQYTWDV